MKHEKTKKTTSFSKVRAALLVLFSAGLILSGWKIAAYLTDASRSQAYWKELQSAVLLTETEREGPGTGTDEGQESPSKAPAEGNKIPEKIDFDRLRDVSEDAAAWLLSPGTPINYAVAQGEDNDYYLRRLLDGTYAGGGTLFIDCRCAADFTDWNTVIYGHYMEDGTMFAELAKYQDPDYYRKHPEMYLYLPGKRLRLELIAGYTTDVSDELYSLPASQEARDKVLEEAIGRSSFVSGVTAGEEDRLVTLSTCSYVYEDARYVVLARIADGESGTASESVTVSESVIVSESGTVS